MIDHAMQESERIQFMISDAIRAQDTEHHFAERSEVRPSTVYALRDRNRSANLITIIRLLDELGMKIEIVPNNVVLLPITDLTPEQVKAVASEKLVPYGYMVQKA